MSDPRNMLCMVLNLALMWGQGAVFCWWSSLGSSCCVLNAASDASTLLVSLVTQSSKSICAPVCVGWLLSWIFGFWSLLTDPTMLGAMSNKVIMLSLLYCVLTHTLTLHSQTPVSGVTNPQLTFANRKQQFTKSKYTIILPQLLCF